MEKLGRVVYKEIKIPLNVQIYSCVCYIEFFMLYDAMCILYVCTCVWARACIEGYKRDHMLHASA